MIGILLIVSEFFQIFWKAGIVEKKVEFGLDY